MKTIKQGGLYRYYKNDKEKEKELVVEGEYYFDTTKGKKR